jgi:mannose-6-phosphate isomerase-like protein (cupin superfamily)
MVSYAVANLREVENQGVRFGLDENDFQLRMARVGLQCEHCGVSYKRYGPGYRDPFGHRHKRQEEIYVLVNGSARMKLDDDIVELEPFTAVRVPPETMRAMEAGPEGAELIAVGAPNTGPGDGETQPGWWSD